MQAGKELFIILHNIRSAHNVGSIMRTADGLGVKKIFLTGYTQAPFSPEMDVYMTQAQKMIAKTALGAQDSVFWEKTADIFSLIKKLKKKKIFIAALEIDKRSKDISRIKWKYPCAIILGNETEGIGKDILAISDAVVAIAMRGRKESFNVSIAGAISMYLALK